MRATATNAPPSAPRFPSILAVCAATRRPPRSLQWWRAPQPCRA